MDNNANSRRLSAAQIEEQLQTILSFLESVHPTLCGEEGFYPCVELRPIPRGIPKDDKRYFPLTWSLNLWKLDDAGIDRLRKFLERHNGEPTCLFYSVFTYDNHKEVHTRKGAPAKSGKITTEAALEAQEIALDFDDIGFTEYTELVDRFEELGIYALWTCSGHGYQAHILLSEPLGKDELRTFVYKFRSKGFPCDANCVDPARVMRLPGTFNNKCFKEERYASEQVDPPRCEVVQDTSQRYDLSFIMDQLNTLETVSREDEAECEAPVRKVAQKSSKTAAAESQEDTALLRRIEYPYLSEFDLPEAVERMLAYTPQGYRNKCLGFLIRFFKNQYKLGKRQISEILDLWSREACDPAYAPEEFKDDFARLYYNYNGLSYDAALTKKFGGIDFDQMVRLRKQSIHIPNSFFKDFEELSVAEVRLYLGIKLLEHTDEDTSQEALSDLLGVSTRNLRPALQHLIKDGHCYLKRGAPKLKIPNTYHTNRIVSAEEGYMSFSYNDIRAYVMELCEQSGRTRSNGDLKLYLFFRWKFFSGEIYMSQSNLGKHVGLAQNSISDVVYRLQERHFLKVIKKRRSKFIEYCEYVLLR